MVNLVWKLKMKSRSVYSHQLHTQMAAEAFNLVIPGLGHSWQRSAMALLRKQYVSENKAVVSWPPCEDGHRLICPSYLFSPTLPSLFHVNVFLPCD